MKRCGGEISRRRLGDDEGMALSSGGDVEEGETASEKNRCQDTYSAEESLQGPRVRLLRLEELKTRSIPYKF
jgi:hypothetical protein